MIVSLSRKEKDKSNWRSLPPGRLHSVWQDRMVEVPAELSRYAYLVVRGTRDPIQLPLIYLYFLMITPWADDLNDTFFVFCFVQDDSEEENHGFATNSWIQFRVLFYRTFLCIIRDTVSRLYVIDYFVAFCVTSFVSAIDVNSVSAWLALRAVFTIYHLGAILLALEGS